MLDLACRNRGTYIKIGQLLGAMDYLLPKEYVHTLKVLHSDAPTSKLSEIEKVCTTINYLAYSFYWCQY